MQSAVLIKLLEDGLGSDIAEDRRTDALCNILRSEAAIRNSIARRALAKAERDTKLGPNQSIYDIAKRVKGGIVQPFHPAIQIIAEVVGFDYPALRQPSAGLSASRALTHPASSPIAPRRNGSSSPVKARGERQQKPEIGPPTWATKEKRADEFVWRWTDKLLAELNSQMSALSSWYTQSRGTSRGSAKNARIDLATAWSVGTDTIKAKTTGESRRRGTSGVHKCT
jgi:hypothetical protein